MKILRIRLQHFRGTRFREVCFPDGGVTIIEGCNESGKSSMAEALDLLFDELDSSQKQRIREVKPVAADCGPEVEVEFSVGPYHLVYAKRWLKQPQTLLQVLAPQPRQWAGRDAHDEVRRILKEHIDLDLWQALRYQQGLSIEQAALGGCRGLQAALDAAAGGAKVGTDQSEDLWARVGTEFLKYFTKGGAPGKERKELAERRAHAEQAAAKLADELADLQATVEAHDGLIPQLGHLAAKIAAQRRAVDEAEAANAQLEGHLREAERLEGQAALAESAARDAHAARQTRLALVERRQKAQEEVDARRRQLEDQAPGLAAAQQAVEEARALREQAITARQAAEEEERQARNDVTLSRDEYDLGDMCERRDRVERAEPERAAAEDFLARCPIDQDKLDEIEAAFAAADRARARLEAESARVKVEALATVEVEIAGGRRSLAAGEAAEEVVSGSLEVAIPGRLRMTITGGAGAHDREDEHREAQGRLDALFAAVGLSGPSALSEARNLERRRQAALSQRDRAAETIQGNLKDLLPAQLAEKIQRARDRIAAWQRERPADRPRPAHHQAALAVAQAAEARVRLAGEAVEDRRTGLEQAEESCRALADRSRQERILLDRAANDLQAAEEELAAARSEISDQGLDEEAARRGAAAQQAGLAHQQAAAAVDADGLERSRLRLENDREVLERLQSERQDTERKLAHLKGLLVAKGEAGLQDSLENAQREAEELGRECRRIEHQAQVADLLRDTMGRHRRKAQETYVAPFRDRLEQLGRIVFGPSLSLELDPAQLWVNSRTLEGMTVPYDGLSMGAKEQLSLLSRLACALLVGRDGAEGVPVIIDDALGNSDAARLQALGAVLGMVGRQVQVIILTCLPERYAHVGPARVVRLGGNGPAEPAAPVGPAPAGEGAAAAATAAGTDDGSVAGPIGGDSPRARILNALRSSAAPLRKSQILSSTELSEAQFRSEVKQLLADNVIVKEGETKAARYRLP